MLAAKQVTAAKTAPGSAGSARCGYVTMGIPTKTASYSGIQAGNSELLIDTIDKNSYFVHFGILTLYPIPFSKVLTNYKMLLDFQIHTIMETNSKIVLSLAVP